MSMQLYQCKEFRLIGFKYDFIYEIILKGLEYS